jgi:hypothetical protein
MDGVIHSPQRKETAYMAYEYIDLMAAPEFSRQRDGDGIATEEIVTWLYRPRRVVVNPDGNTVLTVWTDTRMLTDAQAIARLWEIILEPHIYIPELPLERHNAK